MPMYLIVGTPAAGKSSVARALMRQFAHGVHIPVDDLRHMVVSGLLEPAAQMSLAHLEQTRLARACAVQMATNYTRAGFAVAIDDFWLPDQPDLGYETLEAQRVILLPSLTVTLERLWHRNPDEGSFKHTLEGAIRFLHASIREHPKTAWRVVDSSALSLEQTVHAILALEHGSLSSPQPEIDG